MTFHLITIFPGVFDSYLCESIIGRAIKKKLISLKFYNPRDFARPAKLMRGGVKDNGYRPVDDRPYGGGPGMVMRAEPVLKAVKTASSAIRRRGGNKKILVINFVPSADQFTNVLAKRIAKNYTDVVLICGRYEGIDARVDKILQTKKISIGDYVLTGGELPAMVLIDSVSRQIPGVLGKYESLEEERVSVSEVYTRPETLRYRRKNYRVPRVLLSGHRAKIEEWKRRK